ncbi:MAG: phosphoribosyltransferase family protein [Pseudomonadota bacterium]
MSDVQRFKNRAQAGKMLARQLAAYAPRPAQRAATQAGGDEAPGAIVLALPRGGVPVGFAVAMTLELELDLLLVRKLGLPHQPEYAIGAVGSGGVQVLQPGVPGLMGVTREEVDAITARELAEIDRRARAYRGARPEPALAGRTVIIVDDGIATGSTMAAAVQVARRRQAGRVVVAAPVAPPETLRALEPQVDELVCLSAPPRFRAVSQWYDMFDQTSDEEVQDLLAMAWRNQDDRRLDQQPNREDRT